MTLVVEEYQVEDKDSNLYKDPAVLWYALTEADSKPSALRQALLDKHR